MARPPHHEPHEPEVDGPIRTGSPIAHNTVD
jgi:hypothetical protein